MVSLLEVLKIYLTDDLKSHYIYIYFSFKTQYKVNLGSIKERTAHIIQGKTLMPLWAKKKKQLIGGKIG